MESIYPLAADAILVVHFAFVIFIVGGQLCIIVGAYRKWGWVRNLAFRICHLLAIAVVIAQAWLDRYCPLTIWESRLRQAAGQQAYQGTFVQEWLGKLLYFDAPLWVFAILYSLFGARVLASWFWVRPGQM